METRNELPLSKLRFDPDNPRLSTEMRSVTDETEIIRYMLRDGGLIELMGSIAEMGFSDAEPLLVCPSRTSKSEYTVVEGNRRLAALKLLQDPSLAKVRGGAVDEIVASAKFKPNEIPVIIYSNRDEILDYLGYRHITGIKEWGALEKATYLNQLYQRHIKNVGEADIYKSLAKMIGSRADYTRNYHIAFRLIERANEDAYYGSDIKERDINFSFMSTALSYRNIVRYISEGEEERSLNADLSNLNGENYENLFHWLYDPERKVIDESRQLRELSQVLEYPEATQKLVARASLSEALMFTSAPQELFENFLFNAKNMLKNAKERVETLTMIPDSALDVLEDIAKLTRTIRGSLKELFSEEPNE